jgi:hypothetical protein
MNFGKSSVKVIIMLLVMAACWYLFIKNKPPAGRETPPATSQEASQANAPTGTSVASTQAIDTGRLKIYVDILGRAYGCGYHPEEELARVRNWLDTSLTPGSKAHQANFNEFLESMKISAKQQRENKSSYSCAEVETSLKTTSWP